MRDFLKSIVVLAAALCSAACSTDVEHIADGTPINVSFHTAAVLTRAVGDAENVNRLYVNVYSADGATHYAAASRIIDNYDPAGQSVSLELVKGMSYKISFWAQCDDLHNVDGAAKMVTLSDFSANADKRDAFFAIEPVTVTGSGGKSVELRRPFAQLNFGASDLASAIDAGFQYSGTTLETKSYTQFNLVTGEVGGLQDVSFATTVRMAGNVPTSSGTYDWITMDYILMNEDITFDCKLTVNNSAGTPIVINQAGVPLKRNWRTNVVGSMFVADEEFLVEVLEGFEGEIPVNY